jgi:hypothetical protein
LKEDEANSVPGRYTRLPGKTELSKIPLNRRRLILITAFLILVLGLAVLLRDFVRVAILQPLIDLGWLVWVELQTVPQIVFWALFVLLALIIALRSLSSGPTRGLASFVSRAGTHYSQSSRYHHWKVSLDGLANSQFARERVERDLQYLAMQILADQARVDFEEMRRRQIQGLLDLSAEPQALQDLFLVDHQKRFFVQPARLPRWLAWLLRRPPAPADGDLPALDLEGVIAWLEKQTGRWEQPVENPHGEKAQVG